MGRRIMDLNIYKIKRVQKQDCSVVARDVTSVLDAPEIETIKKRIPVGKIIAVVDEQGGVLGRSLEWKGWWRSYFLVGRLDDSGELNFFLFNGCRNTKYERITMPSIKETDASSLSGDKYWVDAYIFSAETSKNLLEDYCVAIDWYFRKKLPKQKRFLVQEGVKLGTVKGETEGDPHS